MLELPDFEILKKQPKIPHVARTVAQNAVPNKHGTPVHYKVQESRNGKDWWISASLQGMRASNTLHTSTKAKADEWIRAVNSGQVRVRDMYHATKKKDWGWQDTPDAWQRGFEFAKESMQHETRAEMREILREVAKSASSSYDYGFLAAYQDEFDVPRTRSHAVKKSAAPHSSDLHDRIAKALGWSVKDTQSMSMQSLRDLVRPVNPSLAQEMDYMIRSGAYGYGEPLKRKR